MVSILVWKQPILTVLFGFYIYVRGRWTTNDFLLERYCSKDFDEVIKKENKGKNKEDHNERKRRSGMKRGGRVDARGRYYLHKDIISIRILSSLLTRWNDHQSFALTAKEKRIVTIYVIEENISTWISCWSKWCTKINLKLELGTPEPSNVFQKCVIDFLRLIFIIGSYVVQST